MRRIINSIILMIMLLCLTFCEAIDDRPVIINNCNKVIIFSIEHNFSNLRRAYEYHSRIDSIASVTYLENRLETFDPQNFYFSEDTGYFVKLPPHREYRYTRLGEIEDYVFHADSSSFHILIVSEDSLKNNGPYIMYKNNIFSKKLSYKLDSLEKMNWVIKINCEDLE
jgi:hypothetical protein